MTAHRIVDLELSHEFSQVDDAFNWHRIVHRNPDGWVHDMGRDLHDTGLGRLGDELLLELYVSASNSEDHVDPTSVGLVGDLGLIVPVTAIKDAPEKLASLRGQPRVVLDTAVLVHV